MAHQSFACKLNIRLAPNHKRKKATCTPTKSFVAFAVSLLLCRRFVLLPFRTLGRYVDIPLCTECCKTIHHIGADQTTSCSSNVLMKAHIMPQCVSKLPSLQSKIANAMAKMLSAAFATLQRIAQRYQSLSAHFYSWPGKTCFSGSLFMLTMSSYA